MVASDDVVEIRVDIPGRPHGRYGFSAGRLHLTAVAYPDEFIQADLCSVPQTLAGHDVELGALLLATISHPPDCLVPARLLGAVEIMSTSHPGYYLIAVAVADAHFAKTTDIAGLSSFRRSHLEQFFEFQSDGQTPAWRWIDVAEAHHILHQARQAYRLARAERSEFTRLEPAWRPLSVVASPGTAKETEQHTAAEYAYHSLPARFREYVASNLAANERILFGLHRPAMQSARGYHHLFRRAKRLQEAVFIIGDRQVTEVAELMPLDRAGIRYGFVARGGAPERLNSVELLTLQPGGIGLGITWRASGGEERLVWEFPAEQRARVEEAVAMLRGWLTLPDDKRLRRAMLPEPPEAFEPLSDPGANDPADTRRLVEKLLPSLDRCLYPDETLLARCLLPAWIEGRGMASLLAITGRRLLVVPDSEQEGADRLSLSLPHHAITSFEFSSTLLRSYLKVFVPANGQIEEHVIPFGFTLSEMDNCLRMLRQTVAVTPPCNVMPMSMNA